MKRTPRHREGTGHHQRGRALGGGLGERGKRTKKHKWVVTRKSQGSKESIESVVNNTGVAIRGARQLTRNVEGNIV